MSVSQYRRVIIGLALVCAILIALGGFEFVRNGLMNLRVKFAEEQTAIFDAMRAKALNGGPTAAAEALAYTVNYYPSGTKQVAGSSLDQIVERNRALAGRDIIAQLKAATGENLGESAEPWIEKFGPKH